MRRGNILLVAGAAAASLGVYGYARWRAGQDRADEADDQPGPTLAQLIQPELESLRATLVDADELNRQVKSQLLAVQPEVERLKGQVSYLNQRTRPLADRSTHVAGLISDFESVVRQTAEDDRQLHQLLGELDEHTRRLQSQKDRQRSYNDAMGHLLQTLSDQAEKLTGHLERLNAVGADLQSHVERLTQSAEAVVPTVTALSSERERLKVVTDHLAERGQSFSDMDDTLAGHIAALINHESELTEAVRAMKDGQRSLLDQAQLFEATRQDLKDGVDQDATLLDRFEENQSKLKEELRKTRYELGEQQVANRTLTSKNSSLSQQLQRAKEQIDQLQALDREPAAKAGQGNRAASAAERHWSNADLPDTFETLMTWASATFDRLIIAESALQDAQSLDSAIERDRWIADTWRALGSLHQYASTNHQYRGDFYRWCRHSGDQYAWYTERLAMNESDTTMSKHGGTRVFEVDHAVDPSGEIEMQAHIKIQKGGGQHIPRLFFHDDTNGSTRKVHIGFLGPHRLVPNSSSS